MKMSKCNLFKKSFTNKGIGYTFNNKKIQYLFKLSGNNNVLLKLMMANKNVNVSNMRKAGSLHALKVLIQNNVEEIEAFEKTATSDNKAGSFNLKPTTIAVSLHNPNHPANIRTNSFNLPLGYSTKVYITPTAREIDESGKALSEKQRGCRLNVDNQNLTIFQVYTQESCVLECKIRQAYQRCGCVPWNYLMESKV